MLNRKNSKQNGLLQNLKFGKRHIKMKIRFDKETMPDELYNALLKHFVNEAVGLGIQVNKFTEFDNWIVECDCLEKESVH
jgi:hypothetical protein